MTDPASVHAADREGGRRSRWHRRPRLHARRSAPWLAWWTPTPRPGAGPSTRTSPARRSPPPPPSPTSQASRGTAVYLSSISASLTAPWPGLGAYAVTKAALDKLVEAWRAEHPAVGFTRRIVGDCGGGEGDSMTGFASDWDWDLAAELHPVWDQRRYLTGTLIDVEELVNAVARPAAARADGRGADHRARRPAPGWPRPTTDFFPRRHIEPVRRLPLRRQASPRRRWRHRHGRGRRRAGPGRRRRGRGDGPRRVTARRASRRSSSTCADNDSIDAAVDECGGPIARPASRAPASPTARPASRRSTSSATAT